MSTWFRVYGFADVHEELLVGAYPLDARDVGMLSWMKVERVLNLVEDREYEPGERAAVEKAFATTGIEERRFGFTDYGRLPARELEQAVTEVIGWLDQGHRVYLHCRAGWQRSAAVAAGVVAVREEVGIEEALERVRQRKPSADPLPEQREDLLQWWSERTGTVGAEDEPVSAVADAANTGTSAANTEADAANTGTSAANAETAHEPPPAEPAIKTGVGNAQEDAAPAESDGDRRRIRRRR